MINFKPKQVSKKLMSALSDRSSDIIESRYGLGKNTERMTLEAIGDQYGITRERVRQVENHSITAIRKSKQYDDSKSVFDELEQMVHSLGGVVAEQNLLDHISKDTSLQNHINFILVIGNQFKKIKEDDDFRHRWFVNEDMSNKIHASLKKVYENLKDEDLIPETEMIKSFMNHIKDLAEKTKDEEMVKRWLSISKKIGKNPLGEWGKSSSPNVSAKGMRDYAFLIIRKHGSPIHFKEVAKTISEVFNKKAHIATCHNELIKDPRFVLVGRGLYALSEWGYMSGVVKDVIKKVIEKHGPQTKEEILAKVMKERYVKENTIAVNLQNPKYFKKDTNGKYSVVRQ